MITTVDKSQNRTIGLVIAVVTVLTGYVGILAYMETRKHNNINNEVLRLDREIKTLELAQKRWRAKQDGIIE